ncbi:MAG: hypothetical protein HFJ59_06465 [Clostridia bacterium]|nr:hypothetical protein [Clostridia bacterium]
MVFLLIFLIIFLAVVTIRIQVKLKNLEFDSNKQEHFNKNYVVEIKLYIFNFIPILKSKITNKKILKIINNEKIKKELKKQEVKLVENRKDIDIKNTIKSLKNIRVQIDEMKLNITIGTENASITAFMIPIISTVIAIFLSRQIHEYNDKQIFSIKPIYINQNLINIEFSGIFQIKMIHIISTICILNKKRKGDKNERTSNRGTYDYGYE